MSSSLDSHTSQTWGGRFSEATDAFVQEFTASCAFDHLLAHYDIQGSKAHATMLTACGILSAEDLQDILRGLDQIDSEIMAGDFTWQVALEDVHMNIEARLTDIIGDAGKRLHTGRSRNDQVATDIRLYLRAAITSIRAQMTRLRSGLIDQAETYAGTVMPGFTHLQVAQPVTFGHHLLAWNEMLVRDDSRLADCADRMNVCPLGSAALAGTSYAIDRHMTAEALGFKGPTENSLDSVSDRDFAIEFTAAAAITMMHLSRMAEEMIIWTSAQFNFVDLPDRFCTGSSIMPQKKNPDVPELIRGKAGRVQGHLVALITLMKGQPLAYNKDNQEDKEPLFDAVRTVHDSLLAFADLIPALTAKPEFMRRAAGLGHPTATDLADYLVRKGVAFRDAHEIVGTAVGMAEAQSVDVAQLSIETLQALCPVIEHDVFDVLTLDGSVAARDHIGGTAPRQVLAAAKRARAALG
ncbi:MAG: Argininosuccinate lyase [Halieaceae bacterium]|nr:argininosuccinate lyase [Pseudomonadales bacterium]MDA0890873.1 argininosuccinate lyase [Pseudomonadota bacterium]CAI8391123.1 MAG: Argininosuccinate lyase [Halieaceae bacterium]